MKWEIRQKIDLQVMTPQRATPECLFMVGNAQAHRWKVEVYSGGTPVDIDGRLVVAMVQRPDGLVAMLKGIAQGNVAEVVLDSACCGVAGHAQALMTLTSNDQVITVAEMRFRVGGDLGDTVIDSSDMLPSLSELLSQVADMRAATEECVAATDEMRELLENAGSVGGSSGSGGTGTVTSVNGIKPDAAGNVEMDIPQAAEDVGADPAGTAASKVSTHNADEDAHPAIRQLISDLSGRLSALADSDDTTLDQLSEIVAYIKSNKSLIDSITTGKVSTADIVNNLTSTATNKPLSAAQGKALKALIDAIVVPTKVSQLTNDEGYITGYTETDPTVPDWAKKSTKPSYTKSEVGLGNVDNVKQYSASNPPPYSFDPTAYNLPVLYLTGDISPIRASKDNKVTLNYVYGDRTGTCTLKGQGATSYVNAQKLGENGKYNYTINFDTAFEAATGWSVQKKYCLKANTIDHTHSRNLMSARLWGMIVKSRATANAYLSGLPNGGAVDGFPIVLMVNGEFHGLYTFNIPKDGWMMGLVEDATKQQAILSANDRKTATQFKGLLAGDESDFELEFASDKANTEWVTTSLNRMIQACIDSWGEDLDDVVGQYLDWDSVIDYYIFVVVIKGMDMVDKNYLLSTFDGTKWYFTAYDMDSTYGLNWDGSGLSRAVSNVDFASIANDHRAYELVKRFKTNALKARYRELRADILSETRIMQQFENFAWAIPSPVLLEDVKRYPVAVHGSSVNTIDQIGRWVRQRLEAADAWINALPAQETPVEPEQPEEMVNQVPISADADGSIYNGTGYKDDTRLSSSGGVSGTAQTGSVTTGFIPCTNTDVVRIKGAEWLGASLKYSGHYYLNTYNSSKTFIKGIDEGASSDYDSTGAAYSYDDATGVLTIDLSQTTLAPGKGSEATGMAYMRINTYGKGADLIVTINQAITE